MFLESHLEQVLDAVRARAAIPARIELWNGRRYDLSSNPAVTIGIPTRSALRYLISPDLNNLGEAFVEGHIDVDGPIDEIFKVGEGLARATRTAPATLGNSVAAHATARHTRARDRAAISHHYDVSDDFYALFLGRNMVYSCAYYRDENDTLEMAQNRKIDYILRKLALKPGERLLDIGCGWGALILRAAKDYGAIATGITLSRNQYDYARERIAAEGLQDRCRVELTDYRDAGGSYDKISSVGMFEHVGIANLPAYFAKIHALLNDTGLALNHGITTSDVESRWMGLGAGEFIDRYVFPDGELPHISLVLRDMCAAGLEVTDVESLRRHYALTCQAWAGALDANRERAVALAGEKRTRIWRIYLAGCAYGFAHGWMNLYQVLARKTAPDTANPLPLTRDYLYAP
jgi:cyclopropane-fatty-acyl-phospholipid synthase